MEMDSSLEIHGKLFFFRKNDDIKGTPYPLGVGETTIGSSTDADVRLKLNDERLINIHCVIKVEENGTAILINKCQLDPVKVNDKPVNDSITLVDQDMLDLLGKKCQYLSGQKMEENSPTHQKLYKKPAVKNNNRHSMSHAEHMRSAKVKARTSINVQKKPIQRKTTESSGAEFVDTKTPTKRPVKRRNSIEKSKTTSKLIGKKSSVHSTKIRHFSLGNPIQKRQNNLKVSSRNIMLKPSSIHSANKKESADVKNRATTMNKKSGKSSEKKVSQKSVTPKKNDSLIKPIFKRSVTKRLELEPKAITEIKKQSSFLSPPRKSIMKTNFSRNSSKLDSGEFSKLVSFSSKIDNEKIIKRTLSLLAEPRKTLSSDKTVALCLSSTDLSYSSLECSLGSDELFDDEPLEKSLEELNNRTAEPPNKSIFSLRKSSLSEKSDRNTPLLSKETDNAPTEDFIASRRMSRDNPKYYSNDLITKPRCSLNLKKALGSAVGTPIRKSKSLTTSTPMPTNNVDPQERHSLAERSLNLRGNISKKSFNNTLEAVKPTDTNEIIYLTPEDQKGRSSCIDVLESDDLLARLSPIKSPVRRSRSNRLSKSVLEKSFSELSDNEGEHLQNTRNLSRSKNSKSEQLQNSKGNINSSTRNRKNKLLVEESFQQNPNLSQMNVSYSSVSKFPINSTRSSLSQSTNKLHSFYEESPFEEHNRFEGSTNSKYLSQIRSSKIIDLSSFDENESNTTPIALKTREADTSSLNNINESLQIVETKKLISQPDESTSNKENAKMPTPQRKRTTLSANKIGIDEISQCNAENSLQHSMNTSKTRQSKRLGPSTEIINSLHCSSPRSTNLNLSSNLEKQEDCSAKHLQQRAQSKSRQSTEMSILTGDKDFSQLEGSNNHNSSSKSIKSVGTSALKNDDLSKLSVEGCSKQIMNTPELRQSTRLRKLTNSKVEECSDFNDDTPTVSKRNSTESLITIDKSIRSGTLGSPQKSFKYDSLRIIRDESSQEYLQPTKDESTEIRNTCTRFKSARKTKEFVQNESMTFVQTNVFVDSNGKDPSSHGDFLQESVLKANEGRNSLRIESIQSDNSLKVVRKSIRISKIVQITNQSLARTPGKIEENTSSSLESLPVVSKKTNAAPVLNIRAKSLDKGMNKIHSSISKIDVQMRRGRSLAVGIPLHLPNSDSTTSDSDKTMPINPRKSRKPLNVGKYLESIQNSSYKESFGDSFISSKTSTPRRSARREAKNTMTEFSGNSERKMSTLYISVNELTNGDTLQESENDDSSKENSNLLSTTRTPNKHFRRDGTQDNVISENETTSSKSMNYLKKRSGKLSRNDSNLSHSVNSYEIVSLSDSSSESNSDMVVLSKTPTPRLSRRNLSNLSRSSAISTKTPTPQKSANGSGAFDDQFWSDSPYTPTCTPQNNISVIIIDTPYEKSITNRNYSKTLNSSIVDVELTTPKSTGTRTRSKSLPYKPITEDISPASPVTTGRDDSGFKTPFNTPGLFENIKESVLKSRSRLHKTTSSLSVDLMKEFSEGKGLKRRRESTGQSIGLNKRRKVERTGSHGGSLGSFHSEDVILELSVLDATAIPPPHFENLTNKPVIVEPKTRGPKRSQKSKIRKSPRNDLSDVAGLKRLLKTPRKQKSPKNDITNIPSLKKLFSDAQFAQSPSLSNFASIKDSVTPKSMKLSEIDVTNISGVETLMTVLKPIKSPKNHSNIIVGEEQLLKTPKATKSPKTDFSNFTGVKKLMTTPKVIKTFKTDLAKNAGVEKLITTPKSKKSPKNDLTNVAGVKKLMTTPKPIKSPKNDLTNVAGVKKLMATPKPIKSPKNDLTTIVGVKKLMTTPKPMKSPKNDLTNVAGVKKLMRTAKQIKSPRNDLTNVAGVKKLMTTPKPMKSHKNDLTNVAGIKNLWSTPTCKKSPNNDLTNIFGVKKLMSTPKKSTIPHNDLSDVTGVRKLMSTPKVMNTPKNDLTDVEGVSDLLAVHRNSNISDQENNEDLFAQLFNQKPLKTYRGKSMSPLKTGDLQGNTRKTLGDVSDISPRVENWIKEQVKLKQTTLGSAMKTPKGEQVDKNGIKSSEKNVESTSEVVNIDTSMLLELNVALPKEILSPTEFSSKSRKKKTTREVPSTPETSRTRTRQQAVLLKNANEEKIKKIDLAIKPEENQYSPAVFGQTTKGRKKMIVKSPLEHTESATTGAALSGNNDQGKMTRQRRKVLNKDKPEETNVHIEDASKTTRRVRNKKAKVEDKIGEKSEIEFDNQSPIVVGREGEQKEIRDSNTKQIDSESQEIGISQGKTTRLAIRRKILLEEKAELGKSSRRKKNVQQEIEVSVTPASTPQDTRSKRKEAISVDADATKELTSNVQRNTRTAKKTGKVVSLVDKDEVSASLKKTREKEIPDCVNTDSVKRGNRRGKNNYEKEDIEDKQPPEDTTSDIVLRSRSKGGGKVEQAAVDKVVIELSTIRSKQDKNCELTDQEATSVPSSKRGKKAQVVKKSFKVDEILTVDKTETSLPKMTRSRRNVKTEEAAEEGSFTNHSEEIEKTNETVISQSSRQKRNRKKAGEEATDEKLVIDQLKETESKNGKKVIFAEPLISETPIKMRRRNARTGLEVMEEPTETIPKRKRRGRSETEVEDSKEKETVGTPPPKRTRRGVSKENEVPNEVKTRERTRRK